MFKKILEVVVCLMAIVNFASADTIRGIDIDFVTIGYAGNLGDTRAEASPYGCGAVSYEYRIGKYETTNAQWNAFTDAAGVPTGNGDGYSYSSYFTGIQQPTNEVSWYEASQFCNYLTSGDKSQGVYQFSGNKTNPGNFIGINRVAAQATYSTIYFLPTENEWYKAAYYTGSGYSTYANGTDTEPISGVDTNYNDVNSSPWNIGTGTPEQNGTYDMMGNVWEWNETLIGEYYRGLRGGAFGGYGGNHAYLMSSKRDINNPEYEYATGHVGFRIASIPEPCTLGLLALGGLAVARRRQ
jgi:formylglycine-generating enzyme